MNAVFADTSYFIALLNPGDQYASVALQFTRGFTGRMLITWWVVAEVGNFLRSPANRFLFLEFLELVDSETEVEVLPLRQEDLNSGIELFRTRPDKHWSLTDCISFAVMAQHQVSSALTADHHFEQAGFVSLLRRID